jgi:phosphatidylserine decarboxylase
MPVLAADYLAAQLIRVLPRRSIARVVGGACEARLPPKLSRALVALYCRAYKVDLSEAAAGSQPFESFDAFFTRSLVAGCRPTSETPDDFVSPADGFLQASGRTDAGSKITVKGHAYDLATLIGDQEHAREYAGGQFGVIYLSPRDYHRVHAPVDGRVVLVRSLPGDCFPVNRIGERWVRDLFITNRRVAIVQESPAHGRVTIVMVAAMFVGRITLSAIGGHDVPAGSHVVQPPCELARGQELGAFHLGSTVVLVTGPDSRAWQRAPGLIRVGQSMMRAE